MTSGRPRSLQSIKTISPSRATTEQFKQEVEKGLTGWETEPWEIVYVKLYKSQLPVVEQAIETAALMLGTDRSRGYCLVMICADFMAGANLENENPEVLLQSALRFFKFLPGGREADISAPSELKSIVNWVRPRQPRLRLDSEQYERLRNEGLRRDGWRCQSCGTRSSLEVYHKEFRSQSGDDSEQNVITICSVCHATVHHG
jgi:hypothetical protein